MIDVLILENHNMVSDFFALALETYPEIRFNGMATTQKQAMKIISSVGIDIVIINLSMEGSKEFDLRMFPPEIKLIGWSWHDTRWNGKQLEQFGIASYLTCKNSADDLANEIKKVHELMGQSSMESKIELPAGQKGNFSVLTKREKEVLLHIVNERTNKEIAAELFVSTRTIDNHRRNILTKLGVKSTVGLVKLTMQNLEVF